jgi:riboflavin-specific deaminase-like protein
VWSTSSVHKLWPSQPGPELTDAELEQLYDYPPGLDTPWVQANFVASADGAATVDGRSAGLSHPADKRIFALGRDLADVILVGAGTVVAERYAGIKPRELRTERRQSRGLADLPPIAVVSNRCSVPPEAPLLTDTTVPPIVLTCASAAPERRNALADAGADVVVVGDDTVHLPSALQELGKRGLHRVNCEGGPHLMASMLADDLVDQLCLTVAPLLAGAGADRIVVGAELKEPRDLQLASVLHAEGFLLLRYTRAA